MAIQYQEVENIPAGLILYWYETKNGEEISTWWGQLVGSIHRLQVVYDDLDSICNDGKDVSDALNHLTYHVENYFVRAYELRERVLGLLSEITGQRRTVEDLRHPARRQDALMSLQSTVPSLVESAAQILSLLDNDIGLRNMHTHHIFLNLGLSTGNNIYDPHDALLDLEENPDARKRLEEILSNEIKRFAEEYKAKVIAIKEVIWTFLHEVDKLNNQSKTKA
jgi:hypothetical protein